MRTLSVIAVVALAVGCGEAPLTEKTAATGGSTVIEVTPAVFNVDDAPTVEIDVPGMHCGVCAAGVCKVLRSTPGVVDVKADADAKTATVAVDSTAFDAEAALAAIAEKYGEATVINAENAVESIEEVEDEATEG